MQNADNMTIEHEKHNNESEEFVSAIQFPSLQDAETYNLSGTKLHILLFGLGLALFLMAPDMSIPATAIPLITEKFHSTEDISWYMSSYSLAL